MFQNLRLLPLCILPLQLLAQNNEIFKPDSVRKEIDAVQIHSSLHVDGVLNEPEWKLAKPSPRFTEIEPVQGDSAQFETYVRVLYNKQYLYFGIFSKDSLGKKAIRATDFKRDFDFTRHDLVNISIDGFNDNRNAMCFATNAYGVQRQRRITIFILRNNSGKIVEYPKSSF